MSGWETVFAHINIWFFQRSGSPCFLSSSWPVLCCFSHVIFWSFIEPLRLKITTWSAMMPILVLRRQIYWQSFIWCGCQIVEIIVSVQWWRRVFIFNPFCVPLCCTWQCIRSLHSFWLRSNKAKQCPATIVRCIFFSLLFQWSSILKRFCSEKNYPITYHWKLVFCNMYNENLMNKFPNRWCASDIHFFIFL